MYLSRLTFDQREPVIVRALGDLHAMHRLLLQAFPDADDGGAGRVLYRVERPQHPRDLPCVLVQSERMPQWERPAPLLAEQGKALNQIARIEGPKEWTPRFVPGTPLRFRLLASPTVKKEFGPEAAKPGHRRIGLYTEDEQRLWLLRKGEDHGFTVLDVGITPLGKLNGRSPRDGIMTHFGVEYNGMLHVTDAERFALAVIGGIGPGKGFGFGMLSISRV